MFFGYNHRQKDIFLEKGGLSVRILYAEDERDLNRVVTQTLIREHYSVDSCFDGEAALDCLPGAEYDAIILDVMMPGMDGLTLLRTLRARGIKTPVLLLTARDGVSDRVAGLDAGADDYLIKPFALEELTARLRALLRRDSGRADNRIAVADLLIDLAARTARRGEKEIALSSKEFAILEYLALNRGTVLSRDRIEQHVWNYDYAGGSNVVDVYIRYLRKKIDEGFNAKLIHTVRGAGYVLKGPDA